MSKQNRLRATDQQIARLIRELDTLRKQSNRLGWLRVILFGLLFVGSAVALSGVWAVDRGCAIYRVGRAVRNGAPHPSPHRQSHRPTHLVATLEADAGGARRRSIGRKHSAGKPRCSRDYAHPFEADLDVVAERPEDISLHRLLDVATTLGGSRRLRDWLTVAEVDVNAVRARQPLVGELMPRSLAAQPALRRREVGQSRARMPSDGEAVAERKLDTDSLLAWLATASPDEHVCARGSPA